MVDMRNSNTQRLQARETSCFGRAAGSWYVAFLGEAGERLWRTISLDHGAIEIVPKEAPTKSVVSTSKAMSISISVH